MEVLLVLLLLAATAVVAVVAMRGARAAARARAERWSNVPTEPPRPRELTEREREPSDRWLGGEGGLSMRDVVRRFLGDVDDALAPRGAAAARVAAQRASTERAQPASVEQPAGAESGNGRPPVGPATAGGEDPPPRPVRTPRREPPRPVDINSGTVAELQNLPGVGAGAARRIVAHREAHGPFESVAGLEAVDGFDAMRVSRLAERAVVGSPGPAAA